jgi:hypothetical protein
LTKREELSFDRRIMSPVGDHHAARQTLAEVIYFDERALAFKAITDGAFVGHSAGALF